MDDNCVKGFADVGEPRGTDERVGGCAAYVARPRTTTTTTTTTPVRKALVICTDIFGHTPTNVRLIADRFAEDAGVLVVVPDLCDGDAIPLSFMTNRAAFDLGAWMGKHGDAATVPLLRAVVADLRAAHGIERVAVQGYCWGGRYAILGASTGGGDGGQRVADLVVACHPSRVSVPKDIEAIETPALFVCAEVRAFVALRARAHAHECSCVGGGRTHAPGRHPVHAGQRRGDGAHPRGQAAAAPHQVRDQHRPLAPRCPTPWC